VQRSAEGPTALGRTDPLLQGSFLNSTQSSLGVLSSPPLPSPPVSLSLFLYILPFLSLTFSASLFPLLFFFLISFLTYFLNNICILGEISGAITFIKFREFLVGDLASKGLMVPFMPSLLQAGEHLVFLFLPLLHLKLTIYLSVWPEFDWGHAYWLALIRIHS
jgi:hypothetical protein